MGVPASHPTVVHMLRDTVRAYPAREALAMVGAHGTVRLTYAEYAACVAGFARELLALDAGRGVRGERVSVLLPNSLEICIAMFAAHAAGAQVVPLNPLYTGRELEQILADAAPRVLLYDAARADVVGPLAAKLGIAHAIAVTPGDGTLLRWKAGSPELPEPLPEPGALSFVQYTGGTTGRSKGVVLTHASTAINVAQREGLLPTDRREGEAEGERILTVMPLFHSYALAMGIYLSANCAGTMVILPRYHPLEVLRAITGERISIFPGSPTMFTGLMGHADFAATDWSRVHTCYSGSSALPAETLDRWEKAVGAPVYEGYGQTEAGPVLTYNPVHGTRKPGAVGIVLADTEVQVVDTETGTRVMAVGEQGEVRARGPQVMQGYRNLPDETAAALRDGWLYTGDIGEFDGEGYLYIRDRKKDMVIVGGYNVYPREVDDVLFMHPAVQDAAAVGAPDSYRGEVVRAAVVLCPGTAATPEELIEHCKANLAKYKVPVSIEIVAALPKTTVGKTDKKALRAQVGGPAGQGAA